ncbi:MAG: hypothetical protein JO317_04155, partial [Verrucomicrobiae bacterium]|nr:hypothetical protein [Verrucomicrobiae bacterium]
TENTLILETALFYQFATDWYLTMSYSYSHVSSSLALRSYDRNIISSGVRFVY